MRFELVGDVSQRRDDLAGLHARDVVVERADGRPGYDVHVVLGADRHDIDLHCDELYVAASAALAGRLELVSQQWCTRNPLLQTGDCSACCTLIAVECVCDSNWPRVFDLGGEGAYVPAGMRLAVRKEFANPRIA